MDIIIIITSTEFSGGLFDQSGSIDERISRTNQPGRRHHCLQFGYSIKGIHLRFRTKTVTGGEKF